MQKTAAGVARHRIHAVRGAALVGATLALAAVFGDVDAQAEIPTGCAAKIQEVEQALDAAQRAHADNARIAGLRVALAMSHKCDDKTLAKARAAKVAEKQSKVDTRQEVLNRELRDGDANRISRAKQKLDRAMQELDAARIEQRS
ncbi:DUF1090 family protein [Achromobacter sp. UMC71]|uniref:DUF1090 family protein n=1 Tax=Achromobacter sp. UMC71 TaxID=1862320 RepID=UPI001600E271|nr:DUF1090 family protein [Achromobacter sp. UMC71]MBB1623636.1 hypothetical protein [Achromobacter sp. UMC71]